MKNKQKNYVNMQLKTHEWIDCKMSNIIQINYVRMTERKKKTYLDLLKEKLF